MRHIHRLLSAAFTLLPLAFLFFSSACGADTPTPGDAQRGLKVAKFKCTFCHYVENSGGMIAPPMDKSIALADSQVREYEKRAAALKIAQPKAYAAEQVAIEAILAQRDPARRFEMWAAEYLRDTKFDNPLTKMGNVLLTPQEKADVIAWLISKRPSQ